jgi:DNA-binding CsgD family transcriptional regulator
MNNLIHSITHLSEKHSKKIHKLTTPILNQLGLNYFATQTVTNDGLWKIIGNTPEWLAFSADNQFYLHDPSLIDPQRYTSGVTLATAHEHPEFRDTLIKVAVEQYDIDNCLCIIEKNPSSCEFYFFASSAHNKKIVNTYLNNLHYLRQFTQYFKKEAKNILNQADNYQINIAELKKMRFFADDNVLEITQSTPLSALFAKITVREQDCLYYYLQGKTAKETAKQLGLSFRTVEEHLHNLKIKLGCQHKRDLLKLFATY